MGPVASSPHVEDGLHVDRLTDTQRAFDGVASTYDRSNADNSLLRAMRARSRAALGSCVRPGTDVLDLGCGPGTDAEYFAQRGYRVTAIDWSPAMVREAEQRVRSGNLTDRVVVRHLGIQEIDRLAPAAFDAVYSSFGPLNCVPDIDKTARLIADRLEPGGVLVALVIGRVCPWEIALYIARGDWTRATVRFTRGAAAVPLDGQTVWTRYYAPAEFVRVFAAAGFETVSLRALGLFMPPPYLHAFADRHPSLVRGLQRIEDLVGDWPGLRNWGDHFLIVLRKT